MDGARLRDSGGDPENTPLKEGMTMSVIHRHHHATDASVVPAVESVTDHDRGPWFDRALATLRIAFGFTFLWAFLDKTFALGFHTGYDQEGNLDRFGPA